MKSSANSSQTKANRSYDARRRAERSKRRLGLESLEGRALMAGDTAAWNQGLTYEQGPWLTEFAPGDEYWIHYRLNETQLIGSTPPQDHLMTWGMYLSPDAAVDMRDRKIFEDGENAQLAVVDSGFPDYKLPGAEDSFWNNVQPDAQGKAQIWLNFYLKDTQTGAIAWGKPWAMDVVLDKPDILMHSFTARGDTMRFEYEVRGTLPKGEFKIGLVRSTDDNYGSADKNADLLIEEIRVHGEIAKTGRHSFTYKIGPGSGALALPGNGSPEVKGDYFVLAVADYKDEIKERDGNVFNEDNAVALTGGYLASDGVLLVHGTPQADEIKVVANTVSAKLGGKQFSYAFAASKGVTIRAHAGDDTLQGGPGNDTLIGAAGNDVYLFGSGAIGADVLIETTGVDRLDFLTRNTPVEVSLATSTAQKIELGGKGASTITLGSATAFEELFGTSYNDVLRGNSLANKIDGRAGDDTLWGRDGGDTLIGGAGVDKIYGEEGNDWLLGGLGNDILDGMAGDDTIQFEPQSGNDEIREASGTDTLDFSKMNQGITVTLGSTAWQTIVSGAQIKLSSTTTFEKVIGSEFGDKITGNTLDNDIQGRGGNDQLFGRAGNDKLDGGAGIDGIYGGSGNDTLWGGSGSDRFLGTSNDTTSDLYAEDVRVNFASGNKAWLESEIERVDDGLKVLHEQTRNDRLLTRANGAEMTFVRGTTNGTVRGENHENGRITLWDSAFNGALPLANTVVHEIGHNWDDGGAEGVLLAKFSEISGWRQTAASTHTQASNGWHYQTNRANTFPAYNNGYAKTNPYEDIATAFTVYFFGDLPDRRASQVKLSALDSLFASLA